MLVAMLRSTEHTRYLLCLEQGIGEEDVPRVERIIDGFLRAFAVPSADS